MKHNITFQQFFKEKKIVNLWIHWAVDIDRVRFIKRVSHGEVIVISYTQIDR